MTKEEIKAKIKDILLHVHYDGMATVTMAQATDLIMDVLVPVLDDREKLARFKTYVHGRLDEAGIPTDPESPHKKEGCRIGGRLDIVLKDHAQDGFSAGILLNRIAVLVHKANQTWWRDPETNQRILRNVGEILMLIVSELSEAMEGDRKNLMDSHLRHRKMIEVELADALIRILDMAAGFHMDIGGAFVEKMAYNAKRADHKPENRLKKGGKKY